MCTVTKRPADAEKLLADRVSARQNQFEQSTGFDLPSIELARIAESLQLKGDAELIIRTAVQVARKAGRTWEEIAAAAGLNSAQAAFARWGREFPPEEPLQTS